MAKDIVHHFLNRGYQGKAMVVSIDWQSPPILTDRLPEYLDLVPLETKTIKKVCKDLPAKLKTEDERKLHIVEDILVSLKLTISPSAETVNIAEIERLQDFTESTNFTAC